MSIKIQIKQHTNKDYYCDFVNTKGNVVWTSNGRVEFTEKLGRGSLHWCKAFIRQIQNDINTIRNGFIAGRVRRLFELQEMGLISTAKVDQAIDRATTIILLRKDSSVDIVNLVEEVAQRDSRRASVIAARVVSHSLEHAGPNYSGAALVLSKFGSPRAAPAFTKFVRTLRGRSVKVIESPHVFTRMYEAFLTDHLSGIATDLLREIVQIKRIKFTVSTVHEEWIVASDGSNGGSSSEVVEREVEYDCSPICNLIQDELKSRQDRDQYFNWLKAVHGSSDREETGPLSD